jgi:hypothetical protein
MKLSRCLSVLACLNSVQAFAPVARRINALSLSSASSSSSRLRLSSNAEALNEVSKKLRRKSTEMKEGDLSNEIQLEQFQQQQEREEEEGFDDEYKKGILTIAFICLLNSSLAPVWHIVFAGENGPPPLLLNAVVSIVALLGLLVGGSFLDSSRESSSALAESTEEKWQWKSFRGGMELGVWKGLGTKTKCFP